MVFYTIVYRLFGPPEFVVLGCISGQPLLGLGGDPVLTQWGHSADSACFIWWRIVFRGMCPVLSWVRRLAWLPRSWSMMWRKLLEGRVASMLFVLAYHFEVFHSICHCAFIFFFRSCFVAEMLTGRGFHLRKGGRSFVLLDCPEAASLAASSTFSLPLIPSCLGVQMKFTSHFTFNCHSFHPRLPSSSFVLPAPFLYPGLTS